MFQLYDSRNSTGTFQLNKFAPSSSLTDMDELLSEAIRLLIWLCYIGKEYNGSLGTLLLEPTKIFLTSFLFLCHIHFENYSPLSLRQRSSLLLSCALNTPLLNATCLHLPGLVEHMVFSVALKPVAPLCFCVYTSLQCTTGYSYVSYLLSFLVSSTI